jgi:ATP-dependent exoDNAse (exonuclease V) alpha subunit
MAGMDEHAYIKSEIRAAIRVLRICARLTMTNDFFDDIEGLNKLVEAILNARKIEERKCKP